MASPIEQSCRHCGYGRRVDGSLVASIPGAVCPGHDFQTHPLAAEPADHYGSVFFLFVVLPFDKPVYKRKAVPSRSALPPNTSRMEISGTAFAISTRRLITCHHNLFDEIGNATIMNVVLSNRITKDGNGTIVPIGPTMDCTVNRYNAQLDYAILQTDQNTVVVPIPICPAAQLPKVGHKNMYGYYGAIGDFTVNSLPSMKIWRGGPYSILQYEGSSLYTEHGLCRGSSGGAIVNNGYVVAMHQASLHQGRVWLTVKGSSLKLVSEVSSGVTDLSEIYSAFKEGLVLCNIPDIVAATTENN